MSVKSWFSDITNVDAKEDKLFSLKNDRLVVAYFLDGFSASKENEVWLKEPFYSQAREVYIRKGNFFWDKRVEKEIAELLSDGLKALLCGKRKKTKEERALKLEDDFLTPEEKEIIRKIAKGEDLDDDLSGCRPCSGYVKQE